jgi:hypothetical protein
VTPGEAAGLVVDGRVIGVGRRDCRCTGPGAWHRGPGAAPNGTIPPRPGLNVPFLALRRRASLASAPRGLPNERLRAGVMAGQYAHVPPAYLRSSSAWALGPLARAWRTQTPVAPTRGQGVAPVWAGARRPELSQLGRVGPPGHGKLLADDSLDARLVPATMSLRDHA